MNDPTETRGRVFLLSPANCNGKRARMALADTADFEIAARLRNAGGVELGDLFSFVSGLYFRGKLTYATRFAAPPEGDQAIIASGVHVITPNAGLRSPDTRVTREVIRAFATASIDMANDDYRRPLEASARRLHREIGECQVVLLGSIASPKYVDALVEIFGSQLCFPQEFVGRGDMSRGGLLLRQVAEGRELTYVPVAGAVRRGIRPPRLPPLVRATQVPRS
jgi:hypothetical protein